MSTNQTKALAASSAVYGAGVPIPEECEQRPGESIEWYSLFEQYRLIPPEDRTLPELYRRIQAISPKKRFSYRVPVTWRAAFERYEWAARVEAFDRAVIKYRQQLAFEAEQRRLKHEEEIAEAAKQARRQVLDSCIGLFSRLMLDLTPANGQPAKRQVKEVSLTELTGLAKMILEQSRADYNQLPDQNINFGSMRDKELIEYVQSILQSGGGWPG